MAYWIALFFKILTTAVIGTFAVMVFLDFLSRVKIHRRMVKSIKKQMLKSEELSYENFSA